MKREIKFRGKSIRSDEWCYGNLSIYEDERDITGYDIFGEGICDWKDETVDSDTIGQYTGLKDINGKEIYEGDIIKGLDSTKNDILHVVKWDDQTASFEAYLIPFDKYLHKGPLSQNWLDFFDKEVIGNIYDNPELLTEK